jgi:CheY-like chemotaxis protein
MRASLEMTKSRALILLVENDENDLFFFRRALAACEFHGDLRVVESMARAVDYLEGRGEFADRRYYRQPDLIVTDFKLPGQTGVEFVRWLRTKQSYEEIPIVMFSGTALPKDRDAALKEGVRAFFPKSGDFREVCQQMENILQFLPKKEK